MNDKLQIVPAPLCGGYELAAASALGWNQTFTLTDLWAFMRGTP